MNTKSVSIGSAFSSGWNLFMKYPWLLIGGFLLLMAIIVVIEIIPVVGVIALLVIGGPLSAGLYILTLNAAKDANPTIGDIFAGFKNFGKWFGLYWLWIGVCLLAEIPILIGLLISYLTSRATINQTALAGGEPVNPLVAAAATAPVIIGGLITFILILMVSVRYIFAWFAVADEGLGAVESFKRSAQLTEGIRLQLFGVFIVVWLAMAVGSAITCGLGSLVAGPLSSMILASIYLNLKGQAGGAPAPQPAAPESPSQ
jgi:uncharacterized membrane protein